MDDFENTFFNLPTSTFSVCATSGSSNSNGSNSSFPLLGSNVENVCSNNFVQSPTTGNDLESILLANTTASNQNSSNRVDDELATLLDNLPDESISNTASDIEQPSIDSIIGQDSASETPNVTNAASFHTGNQCTVVEKSKLKSNIPVIIKSENLSSSSLLQLKLLKSVELSSSGVTHNPKVVPVTVHSVTSQKHSVVHAIMPIGTPCVRVLPTGSHTLLKQAIVKQEPLEEKPQPRLSLTDPSHLQIIVCNVVASFRVRCHLNLRQIALESIDVIYRRESQKIVMRMRNPKCTAYMWSTGKIVCTGSTSEESAKKAAKKFCRRLLRIGYKIRFADFKIVNVLAVTKMPYAINIREFSQTHQGKNCSYEPELHPGVTFRESTSKATLKIFSTGSVTVTGRSVSRAKNAIHNVFPLFREYYKFDKPNTNLDYEDALPSDTEDFS